MVVGERTGVLARSHAGAPEPRVTGTTTADAPVSTSLSARRRMPLALGVLVSLLSACRVRRGPRCPCAGVWLQSARRHLLMWRAILFVAGLTDRLALGSGRGPRPVVLVGRRELRVGCPPRRDRPPTEIGPRVAQPGLSGRHGRRHVARRRRRSAVATALAASAAGRSYVARRGSSQHPEHPRSARVALALRLRRVAVLAVPAWSSLRRSTGHGNAWRGGYDSGRLRVGDLEPGAELRGPTASSAASSTTCRPRRWRGRPATARHDAGTRGCYTRPGRVAATGAASATPWRRDNVVAGARRVVRPTRRAVARPRHGPDPHHPTGMRRSGAGATLMLLRQRHGQMEFETLTGQRRIRPQLITPYQQLLPDAQLSVRGGLVEDLGYRRCGRTPTRRRCTRAARLPDARLRRLRARHDMQERDRSRTVPSSPTFRRSTRSITRSQSDEPVLLNLVTMQNHVPERRLVRRHGAGVQGVSEEQAREHRRLRARTGVHRRRSRWVARRPASTATSRRWSSSSATTTPGPAATRPPALPTRRWRAHHAVVHLVKPAAGTAPLGVTSSNGFMPLVMDR